MPLFKLLLSILAYFVCFSVKFLFSLRMSIFLYYVKGQNIHYRKVLHTFFFVLSQQKGTKILFETNTDLLHLVSETLNLSEHNYNSYIQGRNRIILIGKSTVKSPNPRLKLLFLRLSYNAPYASACLLPDLEKNKKRKLNWLRKDFN